MSVCSVGVTNMLDFVFPLIGIPVFPGGSTYMNVTRMIQEGETEVINLSVTPYPPPTVNITRGGQVVQNSRITATRQAITISNVLRGDTGQYLVMYTNSEGSATAELNLIVLCELD